MKTTIKCEMCNKPFDLAGYVNVLPCGHHLDKAYFHTNKVGEQALALSRDGMTYSQALDVIYNNIIRKINRNFMKKIKPNQ